MVITYMGQRTLTHRPIDPLHTLLHAITSVSFSHRPFVHAR